MLVLSRKAGQRIHIGDDIVVEVRRVAGNRVTVALEAPRDVRILRGELQEAATEFELELDEEELPTQEQGTRKASRAQTPHIPQLADHVTAGEMVG